MHRLFPVRFSRSFRVLVHRVDVWSGSIPQFALICVILGRGGGGGVWVSCGSHTPNRPVRQVIVVWGPVDGLRTGLTHPRGRVRSGWVVGCRLPAPRTPGVARAPTDSGGFRTRQGAQERDTAWSTASSAPLQVWRAPGRVRSVRRAIVLTTDPHSCVQQLARSPRHTRTPAECSLAVAAGVTARAAPGS